jgi:peptidoglycan/xylan/chitin deacetylase (PgdA/CDA1 family)
MFYFIKTPGWLKKLYGGCMWQMPGEEKIIYLTFDDGPHPIATPFVLDTLKAHNANATFFCIGKNVREQPALYKRILAEGHGVGNHTFSHVNGWKTKAADYLRDIAEAEEVIDSQLFRPPYGRISRGQLKKIAEGIPPLKAIMWTVLSGDFDTHLSPEKCLHNVLEKSGSGSIVVFHDSAKAYEKLAYTLPKTLEYFGKKGYRFEKIIL